MGCGEGFGTGIDFYRVTSGLVLGSVTHPYWDSGELGKINSDLGNYSHYQDKKYLLTYL